MSPTEPAFGEAPPSDDGPPQRRRLSPRARRVLRDLHHRTWELEFLMSGALAVALGQLPARVDVGFARLFPRLGEGAATAALLGYQYVKLILYALILTFLIHIVLRAFWVSLVGLDSVFPRGVRWDRVRVGPVTRAHLKRTLPSVRELIVRTDGVASVLFAGAFYIVAIFLLSVVIAGGTSLALLLASSLLPIRVSTTTVLLAAAVALSLLLSLPALADRLWGDRFAPDGRLARLVRATLSFNMRRLGLGAYGPVQYTLTSQLGGGRAARILFLVLVLLTGTFIVRDILLERERMRFGALPFMPDVPGAAGVDPRYYESQWREAAVVNPVPSLPTDILDEEATFLRLFVPFRPTADPDAVAALCPGLRPVTPTGLHRVRPDRGVQTDTLGAAVDASLSCAARLWEVEVDGRPARERPVFATHPDTRLHGLSWYLDVRGLAPGRHLLTVRRSAEAHAADVEDEEDVRPPRRHEIPFWR